MIENLLLTDAFVKMLLNAKVKHFQR